MAYITRSLQWVAVGAVCPELPERNQLKENLGGGEWTRTTDLRIMSPATPVADKEDKGLSSAESGRLRQKSATPAQQDCTGRNVPMAEEITEGKR